MQRAVGSVIRCFAAAWREEFGASIDETRTFVDFV
jgi:hypothetical protein